MTVDLEDPPAKLLACRIDDWTTDIDVPPASWSYPDIEWRQIVAFRRWSAARREWRASHGLAPAADLRVEGREGSLIGVHPGKPRPTFPREKLGGPR
jgi:hypothetical protein